MLGCAEPARVGAGVRGGNVGCAGLVYAGLARTVLVWAELTSTVELVQTSKPGSLVQSMPA